MGGEGTADCKGSDIVGAEVPEEPFEATVTAPLMVAAANEEDEAEIWDAGGPPQVASNSVAKGTCSHRKQIIRLLLRK